MTPSRSGGLHLADRLAVGELTADLRDVALPTATRVGIESELHRHVRRRQQGELLGDVVFIHTHIMNGGCDRVVRSAVEHRVVRVDADQPDLDLLSFEVVERHLETPHRHLVVDLGVPEVEMERVRSRQAHPGVEQTIDGGRAEHTRSPHEPERELRVVDVFDTDRR